MTFCTTIPWEQEKENLEQLVLQGQTVRQIGAVYGVSRQTISNQLKRLGLKHSLLIRQEKKRSQHFTRYGDTTMNLYRVKKDKFRKKKYNAFRRGVEFDLRFCDLVWPDICPILGIPIDYICGGQTDNSISFDRINPSLGYTKENTILVSFRANRIKNDATIEELEKIFRYYSTL